MRFFVLTVALFAVVYANKKRCPDGGCIAEWQPLCAENSAGEEHTFYNECELVSAQCSSANGWNLKYDGECKPQCGDFCDGERSPVCGVNGDNEFTFTNNCLLEMFKCRSDGAWQFKHEGECPLQCPGSCSWDWKIVCARDGDMVRTFDNICHLEITKCWPKDEWEFLHEGVCPPQETSW